MKLNLKIVELLNRIGMLVETKAKRLAPSDIGTLRANIKYRIEGNRVIIYVDPSIEYAREMEYGMPPRILSEQEKDNLADWAKRHKLPPMAVIRSIQKKGIKAGTPEVPFLSKGMTYRPFLRPALLQSLPEIKLMVKKELGGK